MQEFVHIFLYIPCSCRIFFLSLHACLNFVFKLPPQSPPPLPPLPPSQALRISNQPLASVYFISLRSLTMYNNYIPQVEKSYCDHNNRYYKLKVYKCLDKYMLALQISLLVIYLRRGYSFWVFVTATIGLQKFRLANLYFCKTSTKRTKIEMVCESGRSFQFFPHTWKMQSIMLNCSCVLSLLFQILSRSEFETAWSEESIPDCRVD